MLYMSFQHPEYEISSYTAVDKSYTSQLELDAVTEKLLRDLLETFVQMFRRKPFSSLFPTNATFFLALMLPYQ